MIKLLNIEAFWSQFAWIIPD